MADFRARRLGEVSPDLAQGLATLFGETPAAIHAALGALLPAVGAGMAVRAEHGGIAELMEAARPLLDGGDVAARVQAALVDPVARAEVMAAGRHLAQTVLRAEAEPLAADAAGAAAIGTESATGLLALAGPLALAALTRDLDPATAQALADRLDAERPTLLAALADDRRRRIEALAAEPTPLHGTPAEAAGEAARSAGRWFPWLVAAVLAIALIAGLRGCEDRRQRAAERPPTTPMVTEAPRTIVPVDLPDGSRAALLEGSSALELARLLASDEPLPRAIRLETFEIGPGGPDAAGREAIRALAAVFGAAPVARARLVGHSDGTGEAAAQQRASAERAAAVQAALEQAGVTPGRLASEGVGAAEPLATDETAEGRAQNNRVVLVVTAR